MKLGDVLANNPYSWLAGVLASAIITLTAGFLIANHNDANENVKAQSNQNERIAVLEVKEAMLFNMMIKIDAKVDSVLVCVRADSCGLTRSR